MSIPFTQYVLPDGREKIVTFDADQEVEATARKLIDRGVRFEAEVLRTGEVSFEAVGPEDEHGDPVSLAMEIVPNGPAVIGAVAKLVSDALSELERTKGSPS